jgi:hypothetical protein
MADKDDDSSARLLQLADGVVEDLGSSPCLGVLFCSENTYLSYIWVGLNISVYSLSLREVRVVDRPVCL